MEKPEITTIEEVKAALDDAIENARSMARIYQRDADKALKNAEPYQHEAYALSRVRERMDPQPKPSLVAVPDEAAA